MNDGVKADSTTVTALEIERDAALLNNVQLRAERDRYKAALEDAVRAFQAALRLARELNLELMQPDPPCEDVAHHEAVLAELDAELHNLAPLMRAENGSSTPPS